jgi:hypothetical protein
MAMPTYLEVLHTQTLCDTWCEELSVIAFMAHAG